MKLTITRNSEKKDIIRLMPDNESDIFFIGQLTQNLKKSKSTFGSNTDQPDSKLESIEFTPEVLFEYLTNSFK